MKPKIFLLIAACCAFFIYGCEKEEAVPAEELPQTAQEFITAHFSGASIASVVKEKDRNTSYDVVLSNGFSLDFNGGGECTEIKGNGLQLPASVVPLKVEEYVQTNYANDFIIGWEKEGNNTDFVLSSHIELRFDNEGNFLSRED